MHNCATQPRPLGNNNAAIESDWERETLHNKLAKEFGAWQKLIGGVTAYKQ